MSECLVTTEKTLQSPSRHGQSDRNGWRHPVAIEAKLSSSRLGTRATEISDLSRSGCRLHITRVLPVNHLVTVIIPSLAPLPAKVVWSDGLCSGIEFTRPLADPVMHMIVQRHRRDGFIGI